MNEMKAGTYTRMTDNGDEYINFKFYTDLTVSKKMKFVNSVVNLIVDDTHYNSVIRDLVFDFYIVDIMTDISTMDFKASDNFLDDVEDFLLETNIVDIVKANAFPTLFDELNKAVDDSVEYLTGIHKNPINDALSSLLSTLEKKIDDVDLDSMMGMAQKFVGMTGELTPDIIVNAYMNSDVHKQNLAAIAEAKNSKNDKKNEIKIDESLGEAVRAVVEEGKSESNSKK